jgi:hypothetical protein
MSIRRPFGSGKLALQAAIVHLLCSGEASRPRLVLLRLVLFLLFLLFLFSRRKALLQYLSEMVG